MKTLALGLMATFALSNIALADMKHGEHMNETMPHATEAMPHTMDHGDHATHQMMGQGVHAEGELHMMDHDKVNLSHGPIPAIGWPAMTMDMPLLEGAEIGDVKPGDKVMFMLEKDADGMYGVRAVYPKK